MTHQYSVAVRNAEAAAYEATIGTSAKLQLRTGAPPSDCAQAATGTLLAELSLPSDWMANASAGAVAKTGTWSGTAAAAGTVGHFRIVDNAGTTCHHQGSVTVTGFGGDLTLDTTTIAAIGQAITIGTFQITRGNA